MPRLHVFAKGNVDLRDSLLYSRVGGVLRWNGLNELLRPRGWTARVEHEPATRFDATVLDPPPAELESLCTLVPDRNFRAQFTTRMFDSRADVFALSIQPDVANVLYRHREKGFLLHPDGLSQWPIDARRWLRAHFHSEGLIGADASMRGLETLVGRLRQVSESPIVVFNMSSFVPGEAIRCYEGLDEILSERIRRFNVALIDLSRRLGFSIVDVDRVLAAAGAAERKLDFVHLTGDAYRVVAQEFVDCLDALGVLEREE